MGDFFLRIVEHKAEMLLRIPIHLVDRNGFGIVGGGIKNQGCGDELVCGKRWGWRGEIGG